MEDLFRIGQITGAHGIRGDVKVYPVTSEPERFLTTKHVLLAKEGEEEHTQDAEITKASMFKNMVLVHLKGTDDRNAAEALQGISLWVTRDEALPLEEDEYYFKDLLDLTVVDEENVEIGTVTDILETGSNDVLVVTTGSGKEALLPIIEDCVLEMNPEDGYIVIHRMEGLDL